MENPLKQTLLTADKEYTARFIKFAFARSIKEHNEETCNCELVDGGYGLCYIGQWLEGCTESESVITDFLDAELTELHADFLRK